MKPRPRKFERADLDALIGRSDPYEFWRAEARRHVGQLGLTPDAADTALATVVGVLGRDWLDAELASRKDKKFSLMRVETHPVAGWIDAPNAGSVAEVVELAAYVHALEHVDGFPDVLPMLRTTAQFHRAQTQLAFAFRFLGCGAERLRLEPDTDNGRKADILFSFENRRYVVECYAPGSSGNCWYGDVCDHSMKKILDHADAIGRAVVCITLKRAAGFGPEIRKSLEKDCKIALRRLQALRPQGHLQISKDHYEVELFDTTGIPDAKELALVQALESERAVPFIAGMESRLVPKAHLPMIMRDGSAPSIAISFSAPNFIARMPSGSER